jgi:hypothetical protein
MLRKAGMLRTSKTLALGALGVYALYKSSTFCLRQLTNLKEFASKEQVECQGVMKRFGEELTRRSTVQAQEFSQTVFFTRPVQYVWGLFWERIFSKKSTEKALISLLYQSINKKDFQRESELFGQEWIESCVQEKPVQDASMRLSENTFCKDKRVEKAT